MRAAARNPTTDTSPQSAEKCRGKTLWVPHFTTTLEDGVKVYGYSVRSVQYVVFVGIYKGCDLVVMVRDGAVTETKKVPRSKALAVFQPVAWAETE